jgi:hypothetical protein
MGAASGLASPRPRFRWGGRRFVLCPDVTPSDWPLRTGSEEGQSAIAAGENRLRWLLRRGHARRRGSDGPASPGSRRVPRYRAIPQR